jgi:hypothetical protein
MLVPFYIAWLLISGTSPAVPPPRMDGGDPSAGGRPFILSHDARISLDPSSRVFRCADTMVIGVRDPREKNFSLRFHPAFEISSVSVGGEAAGFESGGGVLVITPESFDTISTVTVEYAGRLDFRSAYTGVSTDRAVLREEEILPWGDRELRRGRLRISVPAEWTVVTAGELEGVTESGDVREWTFAWDTPIPAVGWICAGRYAAPSRFTGSTPISLSLFPGDSADTDSILRLADEVVAAYGEAFSPYRYGTLSIVEVEDWVAGGGILAIAAPSFVMVKQRAFLTDDGFNRVETILPHEIAHQWWMGTVFLRDRDAALLSEGLCEFSSIMFGEGRGRIGKRDSLRNHPLLRPLIQKIRRGAAVPLDSISDIRLDPSRYLKASYVHHMLRDLVGREVFSEFLREFARRYAGRYATISEYRAMAEEASGRSLGWFFDQWVSGVEIPPLRVYNVTSEPAGAGFTVRGRLRIPGYTRFTVRVVLALRTEGGESRTVVNIGLDSTGEYRNDVPFEFVTASTPHTVVVDPDGDLLKMEKLPERFSDLREPGSALMVTGSGTGVLHGRVLAERDSARFAREGWSVEIREDAALTLGDLQRERVILYGEADPNSAVANAAGRFPMSAAAGSMTIGGERISDTTLALLQVVENPWFTGGLLVWILPFSDGAFPEVRPYDHSWVLARGREEIDGGTWDVKDNDLRAVVKTLP